MERLTIDEIIAHCERNVERNEKTMSREQFETGDMSSWFMKEYWEHRQVIEYLKELKAYKSAEEYGLLLRLPCKVGDEVYLINHSICENRKIPLKCVVDEFTFDHGNRCYAVLNGAMSFYALRRFKAVNIEQFGLTVFLTKEEAEAIMDERNGR